MNNEGGTNTCKGFSQLASKGRAWAVMELFIRPFTPIHPYIPTHFSLYFFTKYILLIQNVTRHVPTSLSNPGRGRLGMRSGGPSLNQPPPPKSSISDEAMNDCGPNAILWEGNMELGLASSSPSSLIYTCFCSYLLALTSDWSWVNWKRVGGQHYISNYVPKTGLQQTLMIPASFCTTYAWVEEAVVSEI